MTTIFQVPAEVYAQQMVPYLPAPDTRNFSIASQNTRQIVLRALRCPQKDRNLSGEETTINLIKSTDGTLNALLLQKVKYWTVNLPEFPFDELRNYREKVRKAGGDPNDLATLLENLRPEFNDIDLESDGPIFRQMWISDGSMALTPFDFFAKKIDEGEFKPANLDAALNSAVFRNSLGLLRAVFSHPNAAKIPAMRKGENGGLNLTLLGAIDNKNPEMVSLVLSHPNAAKIPVEGLFGLKGILERVASLPDCEWLGGLQEYQKIVSMILSHPIAAKIPAKILGDLLRAAASGRKSEIVQMVLSHPNAAQIPAECLGAALHSAVSKNKPEIVSMILSHPNAIYIQKEGKNGMKASLNLAIEHQHMEIVRIISAFLEKTNAIKKEEPAPQVVKTVISLKDKAALVHIKNALGSEGSYSIYVRIANLSDEARRRVHEKLCQAHGNPIGDIEYDGRWHILSESTGVIAHHRPIN